MADVCPICEGSGLCIVETPDGTRTAKDCTCRALRRAARQLAAARIPERHAHCTLDDYIPNYGGENRSLASALVQARSFAKAFPWDTNGTGLLLTGSIGVSKTHLAVGCFRLL